MEYPVEQKTMKQSEFWYCKTSISYHFIKKEEYYIQCSLKTQGGSIPIQSSLPLMESQYNQFHRNRHCPHNTQPAAITKKNVSTQTIPYPYHLVNFEKPLSVSLLLRKKSMFDHGILAGKLLEHQNEIRYMLPVQCKIINSLTKVFPFWFPECLLSTNKTSISFPSADRSLARFPCFWMII